MKSTMLLTVALFLISVPAPDAGDIAELTSNFIVPRETSSLMAAENIDARNAAPASVAPAAENSAASEGTAEAGLHHGRSVEPTVQPVKEQPWNRTRKPGES